MERKRIYLDYAATSPLEPRAREAMAHTLETAWANPSSPHEEGRAAKDALEAARSAVAGALGARAREVVFTSGGTEGSNLALRGAALARRDVSPRIVLAAVEYPGVLESAQGLAEEEFEVVLVPPEPDGRIDAERFLEAVGTSAAVAALMLANHETGAIMPVRDVAAGLRTHGIPLVCDAVLAPGRLACDVLSLGADLVVLSGHKVGGPAGSGALYVRRKTKLAPWMRGGRQEERIRPGAENVAACVGLAAALEGALGATPERARRYRALMARLEEQLDGRLDSKRLGPADETSRLPGLITYELPGVEGESTMINLDLEGYAVSTGSTCALGGTEASPGLLAMGLSKQRAASTIRISVGEGTRVEHIEGFASTLCSVVSRLRSLSHRAH